MLKMILVKTKDVFFIALITFTALLFVFPTSFVSQDLGSTVLTVTTFLFGIIAGFYIVVTTTDYNSVKNILATETAAWISLYENMIVYDRASAEKLALLVDAYIRKNFDYEIIDSAKATRAEFDAVALLIRELPKKNEAVWAHEKIREIMDRIVTARQQLTVLGSKALSIFQWLVLGILASLVVISLYGLRSGEFFFDLVAVAISSSIVLILFLIRDLDLYIWNEKTFGFDIFENVLKSLGQLPYYPAESLADGRVCPSENEYRVGIALDYPRDLERKIEVRKMT